MATKKVKAKIKRAAVTKPVVFLIDEEAPDTLVVEAEVPEEHFEELKKKPEGFWHKLFFGD